MRNKGFTLVEILVAVAVFSIVIGVASGLFISALQAQRKSLAYQELLNQTSYLMEYISRALRMASKDTLGSCIAPTLNYEITHFGQGIAFQNYKGECQEFYLEGNLLKENKAGEIFELTSSDFVVNSFKFGPSTSWGQNDNEQPRVTIFLAIQGKERTEIKIQTTLSQRNLDIQR